MSTEIKFPGWRNSHNNGMDRAIGDYELYISQYGEDSASNKGRFYWDVSIGKARLGGIVDTDVEAVSMTESIATLPREVFIERVAAESISEIKKHVQRLETIGASHHIDGFAYGFNSGYKQAQVDISEAIRNIKAPGSAELDDNEASE